MEKGELGPLLRCAVGSSDGWKGRKRRLQDRRGQRGEGVEGAAAPEWIVWTPVFTQLFVSANQNQTLQCALAIILTSNIIQHFTYFWRGCSSSVTYLLSFCVPGSGAGNWGYKRQRMRVRKNSLVIRQADVWQSILILLHFLIVIIWNAPFFFF